MDKGTERDATDTIARAKARDLLFVLSKFEQTASTSYENIRLCICEDKKHSRRGTTDWTLARDIVGELQRLGYVENAPSPRSASQFSAVATTEIAATKDGLLLIAAFRQDRARAYDILFERMLQRHPYFRSFVHVISTESIFAPIITSMKEHVSERYARTAALREDIVATQFDFASLAQNLERRLGRPLSESERDEIVGGSSKLMAEFASALALEDAAKHAKAFVGKLNEIVIPAILRTKGLGFDSRTHRTIWGFGEEFRTWAISRSHPEYDGWLIYRTASMRLTEDEQRLAELRFDHGIDATRDRFLIKLHDAYQKLNKLRGKAGFVVAWELRSVFCVEYHCQPSVFSKLLDEHYTGSEEYSLQLEIERQRPKHEPAVRVKNRNVGLVRVVKK